MRGLILQQANSLQVLQGCVKLLPLLQPQLRARGCTDKSKRTESHSTKECARACELCLKAEPKILLLSHNFSNDMMNSNSLNEFH
jgi:hypothetical protein